MRSQDVLYLLACSHVLVHSINWLAKRKTLNDFTVYLRTMIQ